MKTIDVIKNWIDEDSEILDLGCGKGEILNMLSKELNAKTLGVEIDQDNINECIKSGLNVIQQNIDEGLDNFADKSFDMVIMSQTIQVLKDPKRALLEITRIGKECIVTIPNFGHLTTRFKLLIGGKMPVTGTLPSQWYDTENIHLCTIKDFEDLCRNCGINILEKSFLNGLGHENLSTKNFPNLFAASAIYKISQ